MDALVCFGCFSELSLILQLYELAFMRIFSKSLLMAIGGLFLSSPQPLQRTSWYHIIPIEQWYRTQKIRFSSFQSNWWWQFIFGRSRSPHWTKPERGRSIEETWTRVQEIWRNHHRMGQENLRSAEEMVWSDTPGNQQHLPIILRRIEVTANQFSFTLHRNWRTITSTT